jgi:hypothetical protein
MRNPELTPDQAPVPVDKGLACGRPPLHEFVRLDEAPERAASPGSGTCSRGPRRLATRDEILRQMRTCRAATQRATVRSRGCIGHGSQLVHGREGDENSNERGPCQDDSAQHG